VLDPGGPVANSLNIHLLIFWYETCFYVNFIKPLIAALMAMSLSTATHAAVIETWSGDYLSFNQLYTSDDTSSGNFSYLNDVEIIGLDAFDSSLGTLEGISVTLNGDFEAMADLYSADQIGVPASVDVTGLADLTLELVAWNPGAGSGSPNFLDSAFTTDSLFCFFDFGDWLVPLLILPAPSTWQTLRTQACSIQHY